MEIESPHPQERYKAERPYKRTEIGKKLTVEIQGNEVDLWIKDWNGESLTTVDRSELLAALDASEARS